MRLSTHLALKSANWFIPRRYRFVLAARTSRLLVPRLRRSGLLARGYVSTFFSDYDLALGAVLDRFDQSGVRFDPRWKIDGPDLLVSAHRDRRPVLVVSVHGGLSLLIARAISELGIEYAFVAANPVFPVPGMGRAAKVIPSGRSMLLQLRSALLHDCCVAVMLDGLPEDTRRFEEIKVMGKGLRLTYAPIQVALSCNAQIVFALAATDNRRNLRVSFHESTSRSAGEVLAEFARRMETWHGELHGYSVPYKHPAASQSPSNH